MSTLLKALKRAEQDRRQKLAEAGQTPAAAGPTQLTLPVDADAPPANAPASTTAADPIPAAAATTGEKPRINPLLVPKPHVPVAPAPPRYTGLAVLLSAAGAIAVIANLIYRPAPPVSPVVATAPVATPARPTLETVSIPRSLLGAGPVPLQLQLDRNAERLLEPRGDAAKGSTTRQ